MPILEPSPVPERLLRGRAWIDAGNAVRAQGSQKLRECLGAYDKAADLIGPLCDSEVCPFRDDLASAWMNRGIALANEGSPRALLEAVECFDRAIELRATLALEGNPWLRYNLAGAWLNRGDALARLGDSAHAAEAIASYDNAVHVSQGLDLGIREFSRRVALAYLNCGAVKLRLSGKESLRGACDAFDASLAALGLANHPDALIAASAWVGKAEATAKQESHEEARACARNAIGIVSELESGTRDAAAVGLRARVALCASSCRGLFRKGATAETRGETAEAIDAAEEGLRLGLKWCPDAEVESLVQELFRFGARGYAVTQPQFLCEFIDESLALAGPGHSASWRRIAKRAISDAIGQLASKGILTVGLRDDEAALFGALRAALEIL